MHALSAAAIAWLALHVVVAGPMRPGLVARLGERRYIALFSVASLVLLIALIAAYKAAPVVPLWQAPAWSRGWAFVLMFIASVLLALALTPSNPTLVEAKSTEARGIFRVTRHPGLNAFALWAVAHVPANGELGALFVFATIAATAFNGMRSIDRKRARVAGDAWHAFERSTSRLPFVAILQGRNRWVGSEIELWRIGAAFALYAFAIALHGVLGRSLF